MVNELPQRNRNRIDKTGVDFLGEKEKSTQINHIGTVIGRRGFRRDGTEFFSCKSKQPSA